MDVRRSILRRGIMFVEKESVWPCAGEKHDSLDKWFKYVVEEDTTFDVDHRFNLNRMSLFDVTVNGITNTIFLFSFFSLFKKKLKTLHVKPASFPRFFSFSLFYPRCRSSIARCWYMDDRHGDPRKQSFSKQIFPFILIAEKKKLFRFHGYPYPGPRTQTQSLPDFIPSPTLTEYVKVETNEKDFPFFSPSGKFFFLEEKFAWVAWCALSRAFFDSRINFHFIKIVPPVPSLPSVSLSLFHSIIFKVFSRKKQFNKMVAFLFGYEKRFSSSPIANDFVGPGGVCASFWNSFFSREKG